MWCSVLEHQLLYSVYVLGLACDFYSYVLLIIGIFISWISQVSEQLLELLENRILINDNCLSLVLFSFVAKYHKMSNL